MFLLAAKKSLSKNLTKFIEIEINETKLYC